LFLESDGEAAPFRKFVCSLAFSRQRLYALMKAGKRQSKGLFACEGKPDGKDFKGESRNIKIQEANTRFIRRAHPARHLPSV
jgi:hypothetical protein